MRFSCSLLLTLTLAGALWASDPFRDPKLPIEERVNNLVSLMTLDEKIAFLGLWRTWGGNRAGAVTRSRTAPGGTWRCRSANPRPCQPPGSPPGRGPRRRLDKTIDVTEN